MQEDVNFGEPFRQRPQVNVVDKRNLSFSYIDSSDVMYQKLVQEGKYTDYRKGLLESIYVNGYSRLLYGSYVADTLQKNDLDLFVEDKATVIEKYNVPFSDIFDNTENSDNTFLYITRDSRHFMAVRAIRHCDTMKLYIVNSSPCTIYLPQENDNLIKTIFENTGVQKIVARELKPAIYQLGDFACFLYALKNTKELQQFREDELDSNQFLMEMIDEKTAFHENEFAECSYLNFCMAVNMMKDIHREDPLATEKCIVKTVIEMFKNNNAYRQVKLENPRLAHLNIIRSQRKNIYARNHKTEPAVPQQPRPYQENTNSMDNCMTM